VTTPTGPPPPPDPQTADPWLGPILNQFVVCLCAYFQVEGRPVCACCLVHGSSRPPADFCDCDCDGGHGQAWVRVVRWDPVVQTNRNAMRRCQAFRMRVWIEAGVYRCVHAGGEQGEPPTCQEREGDAWGFIADQRILRTAAMCCPSLQGKQVDFQEGVPTGMLGGCSGTQVQFTMDIDSFLKEPTPQPELAKR
jgi:hypothetical protein